MFELIDFVIVRPITNILFVIYGLVGDFGVAIILFTILIKLLLWPLVKKQMHQTKLMRKIQPELTEIKKRCNGNRQMESLQMMDLYKRNNVKPFRSILLLIIQLPILLAIYTAIRVMVVPTASDNLSIRVYEPLRNFDQIGEVIDLQEVYLSDTENNSYDFKPELFGILDLSAYGSSVLGGVVTWSTLLVFLFSVASAYVQYQTTRQQTPSTKSSKTFRQIMADAKNNIEPDQADLNAVSARQMSIMMPAMMFLIMINLPGALAFYYFLSSLVTFLQQRHALKSAEREMEESSDKAVLKELKKIKEAEIVINKKTGTKVRHLTATDSIKTSSANKPPSKSALKSTQRAKKSRKKS